MQKPLFTMDGTVVAGKQLGRTLGFPTANIAYEPTNGANCFPKDGVYVALVIVHGSGERYAAILNQGHHPTVPDGPSTIEAHMLGLDESIYGRRLTLHYLSFLRPEQTFPHLEALKNQLQQDRESAVAFVQAHPDFFEDPKELN